MFNYKEKEILYQYTYLLYYVCFYVKSCTCGYGKQFLLLTHLYSLSVSPAAEQPWLAVGVIERLSKNKTIELFNLETWQHQYTFHAG